MGGTSPHPHAMGIALAVRGASVEGRLAPTSFEVRYGEHLLVAGPNGSGKTTLLEWIELRPGTWTRLMVAVMRLAGGPDLGILPGSGP